MCGCVYEIDTYIYILYIHGMNKTYITSEINVNIMCLHIHIYMYANVILFLHMHMHVHEFVYDIY